MKVSTKLFNQQQLKNFSSLNEEIQKTQNKISTGKNILLASDDPTGSVQLSGLQVILGRINQYNKNIESSNERLTLLDKNLENINTIMVRAQELIIQASSDVLGPSDRESLALEIDEMKQEILSIANAQDSNGSFLFSGYKTSTLPFVKDNDGLVNYNGDRGVSSLSISESNVMQTTLDGGSVFENIIDNNQMSFSLFELLEDVSASIRTAAAGVNGVKSIAQAELSIYNQNPGEWSFDLTGSDGTQNIKVEIVGDNPTEIVDKINLYVVSTGVTASLKSDGKTILLSDSKNGPLEIKNLSVFGVDRAEKTPKSYIEVSTKDAIGNFLAKNQTLYDDNQRPAKQLDKIVNAQSHISNNRGIVGARVNSLQRQSELLIERQNAVEKDVSDLSDADLSNLVTNLQSLMTSIQASQQAFVKVSQLNLFDYIR